MIKNKKNNGFTLVEILISSSLAIVMLSLITGFFYTFNKASNLRIAKMDLSSSLRPIMERLERDFSSTIKVVYTANINGSSFTSGASEIVVNALAYDEKGNPMFQTDGTPKTDIIGLKVIDLPSTPYNQVSRNGVKYLLKKITLSVEPAPSDNGLDGVSNTSDDIKSSRKKINNQVIFTSLMPIGVTGTYLLPSNNTEYTNTPKLFTFYTPSKLEVTTFTATTVNTISSIKINLLAEKVIQSKTITARQENEIIFRNY